MCFSATASFIAGTTLSAIGVATLKTAKTKSEIPFAMIPLLFGAQQLIEGIIWLSFHYEAPQIRQISIYLYSGFSHTLWPIYVPFSIAILEAVPWRKKVIFGFLVAGIAVGLYLLYYLVVSPVTAEVIGKHIVYISPHFFKIPMMIVYIAATCASCFFSSHAFVRLFGGLALLAFIAAYVIHAMALFSIWCFFAAVLSLLIYFHLRNEGRKPQVVSPHI